VIEENWVVRRNETGILADVWDGGIPRRLRRYGVTPLQMEDVTTQVMVKDRKD
jgi:hypothetical protein